MKKTSEPNPIVVNPSPESEAYFAAKNKARQARKEFAKEAISYLGFIACIAVGVAALLGLGCGLEAVGKKWGQVTANAAAIKEMQGRMDSTIEACNIKFDHYNSNFDVCNANFSDMRRRLDTLDIQFIKLENPQPQPIDVTNPIEVTNFWEIAITNYGTNYWHALTNGVIPN